MDSQDLAFAGIVRQAELLRDGEVSPRELVDLCLDRIDRLDGWLNAFRVVFHERARAEADQAGARLRAGDERPLLGVPVAVKDNVDMAGEISTHGSRAFDRPAEGDSEVVKRLRAAGAVIVGRTQMPELAIYPFTESAAFGVTENPWRSGFSPGGSSGGSGAAVAAGLVGAAYASDGGGSIRIPAACCGLFGLKPQRGRVSLAPYAEHWHGLSMGGCVTRRVADTAAWLDAVSEPAAADPGSPPPPKKPFAEFARTPPGKLRVLLARNPATPPVKLHDEVAGSLEQMAATLRSLGHEVDEGDVSYGETRPLFIPRWMRGIADDARAAPHPERLERRTRELAATGRLIPDGAVAWARRGEEARARQINAVFDRDGYDLVLTPAMPHPPNPIGKYEGRSAFVTTLGVGSVVAYTTVWNMTGQPAASVPAGFASDGLPLAVQLVAPPNEEGRLLSLGAQLEAERGWPERRPPLE